VQSEAVHEFRNPEQHCNWQWVGAWFGAQQSCGIPSCPAPDGGQAIKSPQVIAASVGTYGADWLCTDAWALTFAAHVDATKRRTSDPCLVHSKHLACCKAGRVGTLSSGLLDSMASRRSSCLARQHSRMMSTSRFGMSSDLLASRRQAMATICIAAGHGVTCWSLTRGLLCRSTLMHADQTCDAPKPKGCSPADHCEPWNSVRRTCA